MRIYTDWHRGLLTGVLWTSLVFLALGCSMTVGGVKFCFLDHADLTVTTHHAHADPNAN